MSSDGATPKEEFKSPSFEDQPVVLRLSRILPLCWLSLSVCIPVGIDIPSLSE